MKFYLINFLILFLTIQFSFGQAISDQDDKSELPKLRTESLKVETDIDLFPNPAVDFLNITLKNSKLEQVQIEMYNVIGNKLDFEFDAVSSNNYKVNVKELRAGYYLIIIKDPITRYNKAYKFRKL